MIRRGRDIGENGFHAENESAFRVSYSAAEVFFWKIAGIDLPRPIDTPLRIIPDIGVTARLIARFGG